MIRPAFAALSAFALLAGSLLAGCGADDDQELPDIEAVVIGERASALAPERGELSTQGLILLGNVSRGLVTLDGAGQVVPGLASSWRVSEDGLSIIFRLRKAQWSDGRAITGKDFVKLFRTVLSPGSRHAFKPFLQVIENGEAIANGTMAAGRLGVTAPMSDIVEIRLSAPRPALLSLLARPEMALSDRNFLAVSGGQFALSQRKPDKAWVVTRNPKHENADEIAIGSVVTHNIADAAVAIARFKDDEAALLLGGTTANILATRDAGVDRNIHIDPVAGVYGYRIVRDDGLAGNLYLREALSLTMNRDGVAQMLATPQSQPLLGIAPMGTADLPSPAQPAWAGLRDADRMMRAKSLIAALRIEKSLPDPIIVRFAVPEGFDRKLLEIAVQGWSALGIRVLPLAPGDPTADFALYESFAPADLGTWFLRPFECSRGGFCNEEVDRMLTEARSAPTMVERARLLAQADALLVADHAFLPLVTPLRWSLVKTSIIGWTDNAEAWHPFDSLSIINRRQWPRQ